MKKMLIVLSLLLCLSGCKFVNIVNKDDVCKELDDIFSNSMNLNENRQNNIMKYYSYYLPSAIGEEEIDSDSIVLKYNDSKIIMNLNVSNIINTRYYSNVLLADDGFFNSDYLIYENNGTYGINNKTTGHYVYRLYEYNDTYVLHLLTNMMNYYGTVKLTDIKDVTYLLLNIAVNTSVENDAIISAYSKKELIDYQKKQIDLFDTTAPVNGELSSLLVDGAIIGDGGNSQEGSNGESTDVLPIE